MTDAMQHLTSRVPSELIAKLDEIARQRRMQTGDNVNRADVVREALENISAGRTQAPQAKPKAKDKPQAAPSLLDKALNCPDEREAMRLALDVISLLANDAAQRGHLSGCAQDMGMAVWSACEGREDNQLLTDYVGRLNGALKAL